MDICWAPILFSMINNIKPIAILVFLFNILASGEDMMAWVQNNVPSVPCNHMYSVLITCNLKRYLYIASFLFLCNALVTSSCLRQRAQRGKNKVEEIRNNRGLGDSSIREGVGDAICGVPSVWWAHGHTTFYIYCCLWQSQVIRNHLKNPVKLVSSHSLFFYYPALESKTQIHIISQSEESSFCS